MGPKPANSRTYLMSSHRFLVTSVTNLLISLREINLMITMLRRGFGKALAITILALTLTLVVSGAFVNATQSPPYPFPPTFPVNNFDFTITTSTTLVKIQQGQTGGVVVWLDLYCPNSTATIRCDSTVLQIVTLYISGCPTGAFCSLDRQQVQLPPLYQGASNLIIYTFSTVPVGNNQVAQITVTGVDQFGQSHSTSFGVIVCYC
jgi:hypothetical protein